MATSGGSPSNREARRRRITERGADRLALITGGLKSQPLNPDQPLSASCTTDQNHTVARYSDTTASKPEDLPYLKHESVGELIQQNYSDTPTEPLLSQGNTGINIASVSTAFCGVEKQAPTSSSIQNPPTEHRHKDQSFPKLLTTDQIISTVSASENIRTCFSIAAAVLVILSYIGFPILGWGIIRSTIFFRPFYLLLVTNISYVLAQLILDKPGAEVKPGQKNRVTASSGENGLVDQVGKALELTRLLQNVFGAILMDFSVYAVVLTCGLSLAQRSGW